MPTSIITLEANGHPVQITTDQPITEEWARDMIAYIERTENHWGEKIARTTTAPSITHIAPRRSMAIKPDCCTNEMLLALDALKHRTEHIQNAAPWIVKEFDIPLPEAVTMLKYWIETFNDRMGL